MAERVNHSAASAVATTGWETAKVGLAGWLAAGVIGAVAIAAVAAVPMLAVGAIGGAAGWIGAGGAASGIAATFGSTIGAWVLGIAATIGGVGGLSSPVGPVVGGVAGLFKGVGRVRGESAAYERRQDILQHGAQQAQSAVAQQAFAMGVQAGQQSVVQELQRVHGQMIEAEMAKRQQQVVAAKEPVGKFTANCKTKCDSKVEMVNKQREAQAAAGAQIG